jgi:hypothetical protein
VHDTVPAIARETSSHRYEAVMRISEAIAACREPEELASTLADEIGDFLHFDLLYLYLKRTPENSNISFGVRAFCLSRTCRLKSGQYGTLWRARI